MLPANQAVRSVTAHIASCATEWGCEQHSNAHLQRARKDDSLPVSTPLSHCERVPDGQEVAAHTDTAQLCPPGRPPPPGPQVPNSRNIAEPVFESGPANLTALLDAAEARAAAATRTSAATPPALGPPHRLAALAAAAAVLLAAMRRR